MKRIKLPFRVKKTILACGADLKGAFAFAKDMDAYLFDGFGDLSDLDNFTRYEKAIKAAQKKFKIDPQVVVCDLHPDYFSTHYAIARAQGAIIQIQHHEAHVASAIIDNNIKGGVLGVAFDGTGYGTDGNIWGGEFFTGEIKNLKRFAHLRYIPMPGGEICIREPWRMAASYLYETFGKSSLKLTIEFVKAIDKKKWMMLNNMIIKKINTPLTSSMGRFFDAAASLILNKRIANFEAELPIELERIAGAGIEDAYDTADSANIIKGIVQDIKRGMSASAISAKFHNSVADMILGVAREAKREKVVLSSRVFQNRYLSNRVVNLLIVNNFKVYSHRRVQTNDSGIPLGQIAVANARNLCV